MGALGVCHRLKEAHKYAAGNDCHSFGNSTILHIYTTNTMVKLYTLVSSDHCSTTKRFPGDIQVHQV